MVIKIPAIIAEPIVLATLGLEMRGAKSVIVPIHKKIRGGYIPNSTP